MSVGVTALSSVLEIVSLTKTELLLLVAVTVSDSVSLGIEDSLEVVSVR